MAVKIVLQSLCEPIDHGAALGLFGFQGAKYLYIFLRKITYINFK